MITKRAKHDSKYVRKVSENQKNVINVRARFKQKSYSQGMVKNSTRQ